MKKSFIMGSVVFALFAYFVSFAGMLFAGEATLTLDDNAGSSSFVVQDVDKVNQFKVNSDGQGYFAGNVGIGTTNPGSTAGVTKVLEIANNANVGLVLSTLGARREIYTDSNNALYFADTSGATRVTFSNNGNVGIGTTDPKSTLHNAGSLTVKRVTTDGHYYLTDTDYIVAWTTLITTRIAYLPAAATAGEGRIYIIKDETGNAGTYSITIQPSGSETIDGAATKVINTAYGSVRLYSNGANWFTW